ncbi:hypothetical protein KKH3_15540 [Pectobacterium actinidiae]|nr:hypothetical protein KKH3_15540 [Pectobacterium actinidiae]
MDNNHATDWETIERKYREGALSIRALAREHGISDATIRKRAKLQGWEKPETSRSRDSLNAAIANPRTKPKKSIPQIENQIDSNCPQMKNNNQSAKKNRVGRPSDYMQEVADDICTLLAEGESLRDVCLRPGMPNKATVFRWLAENEGFRDQYAKATDVRADVIFDEIMDIADGVKADASEVAKARLKIDARKWVLSRMAPKKYGERLTQEITGKDGGPINQVNYTPEDYAKAQAALEKLLPDLD